MEICLNEYVHVCVCVCVCEREQEVCHTQFTYSQSIIQPGVSMGIEMANK